MTAGPSRPGRAPGAPDLRPPPGSAEEMPLHWRASPPLRRLTGVAVLCLALAALLGRAELVVVAGPLLWWLAVAARTTPATVEARVGLDPDRCQEHDEITVSCAARFDAPVVGVEAFLRLPDGLHVLAAPVLEERATQDFTLLWRLRADRWGRWTVGPLTLTVRSGGGLRQAVVACPVGQAVAVPEPVAAEAALLPAEMPRRAGEHTVAAPGAGTEFEGLRPYRPGDRPRQVNWAATARSRELVVTTRSDERSFDLVLLLDAFLRVGPAGRDSLDLAVRGAAGLARAHLRRGERVGVVAVGGSLRGLAPGVGAHQLHRIAEAILDLRINDSFVDPDVDRLPRTVLPPGALTVLFSPLLDERARRTATELRRRGHPLVVVDVLCAQPEADRRSPVDPLALRLWELDRRADRLELRAMGVPTVTWDGTTSLGAALHGLRRYPVPGRWT